MLVKPSASVAANVRLFASNVTVKVKTAGRAVLGLTACKSTQGNQCPDDALLTKV